MSILFRVALLASGLAACRAEEEDHFSVLQTRAELSSTNDMEDEDDIEEAVEDADSIGNGRNQKGAMKKKKCKVRCHQHPKNDCKRVCRYQCITKPPPPSVHPLCPKTTTVAATTAAPTTTTSTAAPTPAPTPGPGVPLTEPIFNETNPPTPEDVCGMSIIIATTFEHLAENTLGTNVANPRLFFKNVATTIKNGVEKSLDLTITDASKQGMYANDYATTNVIDGSPFATYVPDYRELTGVYLATARIGIDDPGTYVFRFTITDSDTGMVVKVPMVPLTFYDIDGVGETVATCDATSLIELDSALEQKDGNGCFVHAAKGKEVNLPQNFEDLSSPQKRSSITHVYTDKSYWDVQFHLSAESPARYFIFKSSTVLACDDGSDNDDSSDGGGAAVAATCSGPSDCQPGQSCISGKCKKEKAADA